MLISFFDANGIVHKEFVPPGQTVNQQFYLKVLKDYTIVYGKNNQKCGAAVIGSFTTTMPLSTRPSSVQHFLAKNNMTVIPHHPYSPNLVPCDFFLFPRMKGQMKVKHFADVTEVKKKML